VRDKADATGVVLLARVVKSTGGCG